MRAPCRIAFFLILAPLLGLSVGCRNKTDLVESQLRTKETMYRESLEEQRRSEAQIIALHREIEALRQGAKITPEQASATFGLKRIVLGRATGAFDHDNIPGDELLQVVVEPRDDSDHVIKAPGCLQILALEVTPQGVKTPLCAWDIGPEQLRQSWKQGLLSTGYTLMLPWKNLPTTEQVRVVVRMITSDQRLYEADKDIKVRLVPGAAPRPMEMLPAPASEIGPLLMPTSKTTTAYRPEPATIWRPVPAKTEK
jgi:hypothetical protein